VLVVGASSGIGRAFATRAVRQGAHVVMTARRAERLDEVATDARGGVAVVGDVRRPDDCRRIVAEAVGALGAIDLLLYGAGVAPLRRFDRTTTEDWDQVLQTHVVGAHQTVQAALPHLAAGAVVVLLSSETVGRPRAGLGAYGASKAALEESARAWRTEHPRVRFTSVAIGATYPTEFGDHFDPDLLRSTLEEWTRHGLMTEEMLGTDEVADCLVGVLATMLVHPGVGLEHVVLRPPSPVVGSPSGS
jgi:NAD(P)-dependent dehydrogenase (short-subunit alcohol dehydrogenase family)